MTLHPSRATELRKILTVSLWTASLSMMIAGTVADHDSLAWLAWSLWVQMAAFALTAWWITEAVSSRNRVRVSDLAEIMARVAAEDAQLHRIH